MHVFNEKSAENTAVALEIALKKAIELKGDLILSSNTGASAFKAVELAKQTGFAGRIVMVSSVWGMREAGANSLKNEDRDALERAGVSVVTAAHTLSGCERAISGKFSGAYPVEIIAHSLRMISQGLKVCVEIAAMAMDAGKAEYQKPVVVMGGTGRGLDTACVMTPSYSAKIFDTNIHEILCMPY